MSELYRGKYRVKTTRLKDWDYAKSGYYFVTICTKDKVEWFGKIVDGKMQLSREGSIVEHEWLKTPQIRKNVRLDEYIVMPNHVHGVIIIENDVDDVVETHGNASLPPHAQNRFGPQSRNLAAIVRGYKGSVTVRIRKFGSRDFAWQPRYYDRVIRDSEELDRIRAYIHHNPQKWEVDRNNQDNLFC